jgi:hypothetical protein
LDFNWIIYLHGYRLLYKVAIVKEDFDDEPAAVTKAKVILR